MNRQTDQEGDVYVTHKHTCTCVNMLELPPHTRTQFPGGSQAATFSRLVSALQRLLLAWGARRVRARNGWLASCIGKAETSDGRADLIEVGPGWD